MGKRTAPKAALKPGAWTKDTLPRCVAIVGAESALREEALAAVRKAAFGDADPGMSWVVLHGPATANESDALTPAGFLDEVCTASMFAAPGELKVVVIRQADVFLASKDPREILERNIGHIPESSVLVLEAATYGQFKTTRLYKALGEAGAVAECDALIGKYGDSPDLEIEVEKHAQAKGLKLAPGALAALMSRSAKTLGVIDEELDKLALGLRPAAAQAGAAESGPLPVTVEDIEEICASTRTYGAFNFVDAVLDRDIKRTLEILGAIFERGIADGTKAGKIVTNESAIAIMTLGALTYKMTQLQDIQAALESGQREYDAFGAAKVFGPRQEAYRRTLRKHTGASLRRCVEALFQANLALRRGGAQPSEVLERLSWAIAKS